MHAIHLSIGISRHGEIWLDLLSLHSEKKNKKNKTEIVVACKSVINPSNPRSDNEKWVQNPRILFSKYERLKMYQVPQMSQNPISFGSWILKKSQFWKLYRTTEDRIWLLKCTCFFLENLLVFNI